MPYFDMGRYKGEIVSQAVAEGEGKKAASIQLECQIKGFYTEDGDGGWEFTEKTYNFSRTIYLPLTEKTLGTDKEPGWVTQTLLHLGWNGVFSTLDPAAGEKHQSFVGTEVDLWCSHESYEGKEREKWSISRGDKGQKKDVKSLAPKGLRELDLKFGKLLKGAVAAKPAPHTMNGSATKAGGKKAKGQEGNGQAGTATAELPPPENGADDGSDIPF